MSNDTLLRAVFVTVLATASVLLVLVLRDMNNLKWDKDSWTWQPLKNLFRNLDLTPYFPADNLHETKFKKGEKYRVSALPVDLDNLDNRVVETRVFGAKQR
jgi:hypothetical protein